MKLVGRDSFYANGLAKLMRSMKGIIYFFDEQKIKFDASPTVVVMWVG